MISIFNGRERTLGGSTTEIYAQVSVDFRQHLHHLKGAKLSVFLAISLHADARGWAFPSRQLLARETGYNIHTISQALSELCRITINGQRLLLRYQRASYNGTFSTNRYLIFPSPEECAQYQADQLSLPCVGKPYTEKPYTEKPCTENPHTKKNHTKGDTSPKNTQADEEEPIVICPIHKVTLHLCKATDGSKDTWYAHKLPDGTWCKPDLPQPRTSPFTPEYCEKWGIMH